MRNVQRPLAAGPGDLDVEVRQGHADQAELAGRHGDFEVLMFPGRLAAE
jgi:hypothetical protein